MRVPAGHSVRTKLDHLAAERGCDAEVMAVGADVHFPDYDEWFIREVNKGLMQVENSEVMTHEQVGAHIEELLTTKQPRR